jgi:hypothetical protein
VPVKDTNTLFANNRSITVKQVVLYVTPYARNTKQGNNISTQYKTTFSRCVDEDSSVMI